MAISKKNALIIDVIITVILLIGTFGGTDWEWLFSPEGAGLLIFVILLYLVFIGVAIGVTGWAFLSKEPSVAPVRHPTPSSTTTTPSQWGKGNGQPPRGVHIPIIGEVRGVPRLQFWCYNCKREPKINARGWSPEEINKEHNCPTCNTPVLGFYTEPNKESWYKFAFGIAFFGGGTFTGVMESQFGSYGVIPALIIFGLTIVQIVVGLFLIWSSTQVLKFKEPPEYATTRVTAYPNSVFFREMIIMVGIGLLFGFLIWLFNTMVLLPILT